MSGLKVVIQLLVTSYFFLTKRQYFKSNIHRRKIKREEKEIVAMLHASVTAYAVLFADKSLNLKAVTI